jgi:hypothetical protein
MSSRLDVNDQPMSAQVITVDAVSEDSIDLGEAGIDKTVNTPMCYMIVPRNDAGGVAVATSYKFSAIEDTAANLATAVSVLSSVTVAGSAVKNGVPIILPLPKGSMTKRYQGIDVDVTGGTSPTVTLDAWLVPMAEVESTKAYPARPSGSYPA